MTWEEFRAARLALAERRVGAPVREVQHAEDAAFDAAADALRKRAARGSG